MLLHSNDSRVKVPLRTLFQPEILPCRQFWIYLIVDIHLSIFHSHESFKVIMNVFIRKVGTLPSMLVIDKSKVIEKGTLM